MMCVLFLTWQVWYGPLGFHRFEWLQLDTNHGCLPDRRILATHEQMLNNQIYVGCNSLAQDDQRVIACFCVLFLFLSGSTCIDICFCWSNINRKQTFKFDHCDHVPKPTDKLYSILIPVTGWHSGALLMVKVKVMVARYGLWSCTSN